MQGQELDSMTLVGPFHPWIFYQQQHFLLSILCVSAQLQSPGVIFSLFSAFSSLAAAKHVQIVSPSYQEGSRDFPATLVVLAAASGLQKSLHSHRQEEDE